MSIKPLRVIFRLDGSGVCFDPCEPIHLDALLAWCLAPMHTTGEPPARDEPPQDIPLPLCKWRIGGEWGWHASALFPVGEGFETLRFWRKKFRVGRAELFSGQANSKTGPTREYNQPVAVTLCREMEAFALGDRKRVAQVLRKNLRYIGIKRSQGLGRLTGIDVEVVGEDLSLYRDGVAQRYIPNEDGDRVVRPRPPYWNIVGAVPCLDVGDQTK